MATLFIAYPDELFEDELFFLQFFALAHFATRPIDCNRGCQNAISEKGHITNEKANL